LGGGLVKGVWFRRCAVEEVPQFERIVQSWDTASKATELNPTLPSPACGGGKGGVRELRHSGQEPLSARRIAAAHGIPELKCTVRAQYERFRPSVVLIEDKASGTQLIQELIAEGIYAVTRYQP
jgi:phage terminase large subunit-like protein